MSRYSALDENGRTIRAWNTTEANARRYMVQFVPWATRLVDSSGRVIVAR